MILYHVTKREFLPGIRERGLVPHVPGVVWNGGDSDVATITGGKSVVWLTADKSEWRHDAHVKDQNSETRLLTVRLEPNSKRLVRYAPWLHDLDPDFMSNGKLVLGFTSRKGAGRRKMSKRGTSISAPFAPTGSLMDC